MKLRHIPLAMACWSAVQAPASAAPAKAHPISPACGKFAKQIRTYEAYIDDWMKRQNITGFTVGFTKDGCEWVRGFGLADVENNVAMEADSSYRYASVQKSMTAVAVLQLVEQGKIKLDEAIQTYVPYFPKKRFPITVRQLLGHLGGIAHYPHPQRTKDLTVPLTTRETIALFADEELAAEPGTKFVYSTFGYNLLGAAIEQVSGQSYGDYMRDHVFVPADMAGTMMEDPLKIVPKRVRGYQLIDGKLANSMFVNVSNRFAAGGTRGTVPDLLHFMNAINQGKLLNKESVALMYAPMKTKDGAVSGQDHTAGYTMSWNLQVRNGSWFVHNDGGQPETRTFMLNYPEKNYTFAMAQNIEKNGNGEEVFKLYELILGQKFSF